MPDELTVEIALPEKTMPATGSPPARGRVARVSKLMALAIRVDDLIRLRRLRDYTELAMIGKMSKARATQLMNLLNLAPDIQEWLLFLPAVTTWRDGIA